MPENQIIDRCGWCQVQTALNEVARHQKDFEQEDYGLVESRSWVLYECVSCGRPTLREEWWHEYLEEGSTDTLLPTGERDDSALHPEVARAWKAALAVRYVEPNAFAVLTGRTLEVIARVEGAQGKTLVQKLTDLARSGRVPGPLADMAQTLRQIRNLGAHDTGDEVKATDVAAIFEFADAIIEYLYRAPAKIKAVEARLGKQT